jgi:2'-5' RNA ligase
MPASVTQDNMYFIALIPPEPERSVVQQIKEKYASEYGPVHALKSPPHITLIPPFGLPIQDEVNLITLLDEFAAKCSSFRVEVNGFGCFKPRVIFIQPVPNSEMAGLQERLSDQFFNTFLLERSMRKDFHPHMTIAFKDLSPKVFHDSWEVFKNEPFKFSFKIDRIALLRHDGKKWEVRTEFLFGMHHSQN